MGLVGSSCSGLSTRFTAIQALSFQYLPGRTAQDILGIKCPGRNSHLQTRRLSRPQQTNFVQATHVNRLQMKSLKSQISIFSLFLGFTIFRLKEMENYLHELNGIFVFIVNCYSEEKVGRN